MPSLDGRVNGIANWIGRLVTGNGLSEGNPPFSETGPLRFGWWTEGFWSGHFEFGRDGFTRVTDNTRQAKKQEVSKTTLHLLLPPSYSDNGSDRGANMLAPHCCS